jgi:FG-GAP repeat
MSTACGPFSSRIKTRAQRARGTLESVAALQTANGSVSGRVAPGAGALASWRALVAAALLSMALGAGLYETFARQHSAVTPAARVGASERGLARTSLHKRALHGKGLSSLSLAAQGPVSQALGADSSAYRVSAFNGGFAAASPAQRLGLRFDRSGVSLSSGVTHVGLSLRAIGYGASLRALGSVAPRMKANRVLYSRAGLSEWYVNGPLGLEQGFTIPRAPSGHPAGALTLSMALSGNAHASLAPGGQSVTLSRTGGPVLRYSGLRTTDAQGRVLHSWLSLHAGRLLLRVDARSARYPLRIDPFFQQGSKLTGSGESGKGQVGFSVALSSDGNTALIGGPGDGSEAGAAWVFTRSAGVWTQQGGKLTGSGESGKGEFGFSVALGATKEGNTALIGGPGDNSLSGAAWVFTRTAGVWTQQGAKLTGSGESGAGQFGVSVALASNEGNTALIGGRADNTEVGAAWVFTRTTGVWSQQGSKLTGSGESGKGDFGSSVALASEGNTALIGGRGDSAFVGAAWVFTRSAGVWTQQAKLTGGGGSGAPDLGESVALSSLGNTALVGGPGDNALAGAAWVFTRSESGAWTQQGTKLTGSGESGAGEFGNSVALSSEGNTALIGGPGDTTAVGAAWFFTRSGSTWTQQGAKRTGSGESGAANFGGSVALSEGTTALIGGPGDSTETGAAWVFVFATPVAPAVVTGVASSITQSSATLNATVNPHGGEVSECKFEYGETTSYGKTEKCSPASLGQGESPVAVSASVTHLSANTTYDFRISATNAGGTSTGSNATFKTLANVGTAPTVVTGSASPVGSHSATLNATVNPNGGNVYECEFEYGETTSYGKTEKCTSLPGEGNLPIAVSASVTGLTANTTYHFRISAYNPGGNSKDGDAMFKTQLVAAPTVVTAAASSITQTSATLNATVNPNEDEVSKCQFEYGETISYGKTEKCKSLPGSGTSPVAVSASITGLSNKKTYHFRISATNAGGTSVGSDKSFTATSPHWYANKSILEEGTLLGTIGWGTLKLTNASLGEVECRTVIGAKSENPIGGGTAVGKILALYPYECVSASCKALGGTGIEATAEKLPWSVEVTEPEAGVFRMRTGNKLKTVEAVFLRVNCIGKINAQFSGEYSPRILNNGSTIGSKPGEVEFDQPGSGELESEVGAGKIAGKFKTEGYEEEEIIEVKNP